MPSGIIFRIPISFIRPMPYLSSPVPVWQIYFLRIRRSTFCGMPTYGCGLVKPICFAYLYHDHLWGADLYSGLPDGQIGLPGLFRSRPCPGALSMVAGYFQHRLANPPVNNRSAVCILGGCRCVLVVTRWYGADGQTLDMAGDQRRFNGLDQTLRLCSGAGIYQRYGFLVVAYTRPGGSMDL